ncbi:hypothetical protein ZWY2020_010702 [Hordeum vulgare]|nr:hypothetical protein ZWY2020_010702 [Hordeum vulgare]
MVCLYCFQSYLMHFRDLSRPFTCPKKEGSQELYGCFSPRVGDVASSLSTLSPLLPTTEVEPIAVLEAPVVQIIPDIQDLCLSPVLPLSMERLEVDSLLTSCEGHVSPVSCEQVEVPKSIVSVVPLDDVDVLVVSMADDVDADGMLAPGPLEPSQSLAFGDRGHVMSMHDKVNEIRFEIEIYSLLKSLEADSPGSGKVIVEEALRKQSKKRGTIEKASEAA